MNIFVSLAIFFTLSLFAPVVKGHAGLSGYLPAARTNLCGVAARDGASWTMV